MPSRARASPVPPRASLAGEDPKLPPLYHRQKREQQLAAKQRKGESRAAAEVGASAGPAAQGGASGAGAEAEGAARGSSGGGGRLGESGAGHEDASSRPGEATPAVELEFVWGVYEVRKISILGPVWVLVWTQPDTDWRRTAQAIAPHFSATRFAVWPAVRAFLGSLPQGARAGSPDANAPLQPNCNIGRQT